MQFYSYSLHKNFNAIIGNVVWLSVLGYFIFHIISGARGAISWIQLSKEVVVVEKKLSDLQEENAFLANKIKSIRSDNLDLDLLEEQVRNILGFAYKNDLIVLLPRTK